MSKTKEICLKCLYCLSRAQLLSFFTQMKPLGHSPLFHIQWKRLEGQHRAETPTPQHIPSSTTPTSLNEPICAEHSAVCFSICPSSSAAWQIIINRIKAYERSCAKELCMVRLSLGSWVTESDNGVLHCFCFHMQHCNISARVNPNPKVNQILLMLSSKWNYYRYSFITEHVPVSFLETAWKNVISSILCKYLGSS